MEEKLRKYEVKAEGHEFIPAMLHLFKRYVEGEKLENKNQLDKRLMDALDQIPEAKSLLKMVVERHEKISPEKKRRVFSPKYLNLPIEQPIEVGPEMQTL